MLKGTQKMDLIGDSKGMEFDEQSQYWIHIRQNANPKKMTQYKKEGQLQFNCRNISHF